MRQTLELTTLGELEPGDGVNLELPLRASDRLGGHVVQGHVDGTGTVAAIEEDGFARRLRLELPEELLAYVVERGSIAIEGVSLTVAGLGEGWAEVSLIPETLERTTLGERREGDRVNVETDVLARYVRRLLPGDVTDRSHPLIGEQLRPMAKERAKAGREGERLPFATVEEAIEEIRRGRMVVVCDDENRENEGDLTMAAQFATPEAINFMATHGRGLICLALTDERCDELGLDLMAAKNESPFETAFTVSVEARDGITTGISAHDRARTIQVAIDPHSGPEDLVQPGHVFPLKAKDGGVLERTGQTEAAVDLARLAGLIPAGVICEVMNEDGTMARVPDLIRVLRAARAEDDHRRRPDRLPATDREADRAHRLDQVADEVR